MLIIIITVAILGIGITLQKTRRSDLAEEVGYWVTLIGGFCLAVELLILILLHSLAPMYIVKNEKRYESLTYQYYNDLYDNDNDIGKKELMKEIQEWNEDLAGYKRGAHSPLVGWFIPDGFADFDYIELKGAGQ